VILLPIKFAFLYKQEDCDETQSCFDRHSIPEKGRSQVNKGA
jgi:hypothetical protein